MCESIIIVTINNYADDRTSIILRKNIIFLRK